MPRDCFILKDVQYDVDKLIQDSREAQKHNRYLKKNKGWSAIPLRTWMGKQERYLNDKCLHAKANVKFKPTTALKNCPYFQKIIREMGTNVYLVRILKLKAGSKIGSHTDSKIFKHDKKVIRCHVPITTDPKVKFMIGKKTHFLQPGKVWYTNVNKKHAVTNNWNRDRLHLVIDVKPTPEMLRQIKGKQV